MVANWARLIRNVLSAVGVFRCLAWRDRPSRFAWTTRWAGTSIRRARKPVELGVSSRATRFAGPRSCCAYVSPNCGHHDSATPNRRCHGRWRDRTDRAAAWARAG